MYYCDRVFFSRPRVSFIYFIAYNIRFIYTSGSCTHNTIIIIIKFHFVRMRAHCAYCVYIHETAEEFERPTKYIGFLNLNWPIAQLGYFEYVTKSRRPREKNYVKFYVFIFVHFVSTFA